MRPLVSRTTRRRMRYECEVQLDDAARWPVVSQQTLARILEDKRPLSGGEFRLLQDLDGAALSRFAGPYFQAVDDGPGPAPPRIMVTHQNNAAALTGIPPAAAEMVVLQPGSHGYEVAGRLRAP